MVETRTEALVTGVPRLSRKHLSRPRLLELLDPDTPLTVVRGPTGSGKTALLSEWARCLSVSGLWVTMPEDVDSRLGYWRTVVTAMGDAGLLDADSPLAGDLDLPTLRRTVVRGFRRLRRRLVLIVDNSGNLIDPDIDDDLLALTLDVEEVSVVVAGRARSTLEDPRGQIQVDQRVIGPADLAFTREEVNELLRHEAVHHSPDGGRLLHEATGGNPALVRGVLQQSGAVAGDFIEHVGLQQFITAAVRAELRRTSEDPSGQELATFLLRCSLPDHLPSELIEHFGAGTGQQNLQQLEMLGVLQTDPVTGHARVLPAIRDLLRDEARTRLRSEVPALHTRIAHWELRQGDPLRALRHAVASGDYAMVRAVIIRHWVAFLWEGMLADAEEILQQVPRAALQDEPLVAALLALAINLDPNRRGRALRYLSTAIDGARGARRASSRKYRLLVGVVETSLARIAGEPDLLTRTRTVARALEQWASDVAHRQDEPLFRTQLAITLFRAGRGDEALDLLRDATSAPADSPGLAQHQALTIKAGIHADLGAMRYSRELLARADELTWPPGLRESYLGVLAHVATAWDRLEAFDMAGAQQHVDAIAPTSVHVEFHPYLAVMRALTGAYQGKANEALIRLNEDMRRMRLERRMLAAEELRLEKVGALLSLLAGRLGEARTKLGGAGNAPINSMLRAVNELIAGRPEEALVQLAARVRDPTTPRSAAPQHLVLAAAALRTGDESVALDALQQLAALMTHHGLRSHLVYVPRSDLIALRDFLAKKRPDLGDVFGDLTAVPDLLPSPGNVELLSRRELAVLVELSRSASTAEIARAQGVSVNTVKSQLRSVYRKLGAHAREDALAIALREGLLRR